MRKADRDRFNDLLTDVMAFYRHDVSEFSMSVWWKACEPFEFEQVATAMTAHATDPDHGQYAPKPADIVRLLRGTQVDRSLIAWGKLLDAMQRVGAYESVVFDDGAIHAAVSDMGGWPALCRSEEDDLPFTQKRFCELHRAYSSRPNVNYPARLIGDHEIVNNVKGFKCAAPVLIGNVEAAKSVEALGSSHGKTLITRAADAAVKAIK